MYQHTIGVRLMGLLRAYNRDATRATFHTNPLDKLQRKQAVSSGRGAPNCHTPSLTALSPRIVSQSQLDSSADTTARACPSGEVSENTRTILPSAPIKNATFVVPPCSDTHPNDLAMCPCSSATRR